jgi:hypothetical protein
MGATTVEVSMLSIRKAGLVGGEHGRLAALEHCMRRVDG